MWFKEVINTANLFLDEWLKLEKKECSTDFRITDVAMLIEDIFVLAFCNSTYTYLIKVFWNNTGYSFLLNEQVFPGGPYQLSVTKILYLFIWGDHIFLSFDGGNTFLKIKYEGPTITSFLSDQFDHFVVVASDMMMWYGMPEYNHVLQLPFSIIVGDVFLFDSSNTLTKISYQNVGKKSCLLRTELSIQSLLYEVSFIPKLNEAENQFLNKCSYLSNCELPNEINSQMPDLFPITLKCQLTSLIIYADQIEYFSRVERIFHSVHTPFISMKDFSKCQTQDNSLLKETFLDYLISEYPDLIFLGMEDCFTFSIEVSLNIENLFSDEFDLTDVELSHKLIDTSVLFVNISKSIDWFERIVLFKVFLCDAGVLRLQGYPGFSLAQTVVHFQVYPRNFYCFTENSMKTHFSISVQSGCPPRRKVIINFMKSKEQQRHYCNEENCFLFSKLFNPVFELVDEVTRAKEVFRSPFNITIIGGGGEEDLTYYNQELIQNFNKGKRSLLIWIPSPDGGYYWLCGSQSPCGFVVPRFPNTAHYYFLLRFSNIGFNDSNCDYTFDFKIKLHGIPPNVLYPSLFIVLLSIGVMLLFVFAIFSIDCCFPEFFTSISRFPEFFTSIPRFTKFFTSIPVSFQFKFRFRVNNKVGCIINDSEEPNELQSR